MNQSKNKSPRRTKAIVACLALLAVGTGGVVASGAYFTDQISISGNVLKAAKVFLGAPDATTEPNTNTNLTMNDVLPLSTAQVDTLATTRTLKLINKGTVPVEWKVVASDPSTGGDADAVMAGSLQIQTKLDSGAWSGAMSLTDFKKSGLKSAASTTLAVNDTATILIRAYLPKETDNLTQEKSATFNLKLRAIQIGLGAEIDDDANYLVLTNGHS
jgi:hypothetical protein